MLICVFVNMKMRKFANVKLNMYSKLFMCKDKEMNKLNSAISFKK